jgi:hypothetical protein
MSVIGSFRSLIRNVFRRERVESELDLEVRSYADLLEEEKMSRGMSPEEARRAARMEMGGPEQIKEVVGGARAGAWIETVWQDLRSGRADLAPESRLCGDCDPNAGARNRSEYCYLQRRSSSFVEFAAVSTT